MKCSKDGCRAALAWAGQKDDPAIAKLAKQSGWKVLESIGWLCPRHLAMIKGKHT